MEWTLSVKVQKEDRFPVCAGRMTDNGIISVWRVVAPPGYGALGDVVSVGLDPPNAPVQASPFSRFSLFACSSY